MKLKPGYKLTEVGVIPEEWEVKTLGDICAISSGTTPARKYADRYYHNGTIHWVKTLDLNNSDITNTEERVTPIAVNETSLQVYSSGTVLIAMYGGFNQIGRTGLLRISAAVNQALTAVHPSHNILFPEYLLSILNFKVDYWKTVASSSRKDPNITSNDIRHFSFPLPPLPEQHAIAEALSDMDALLAALDQLIAKKRDLKQATMQQLLTGAIRLPGFRGEWEVRRLGEIVEIKKGQLITNDTRVSGDIPVIAGGKQPAYYHNTANRHGRTITISGSGANAGYVALYNTPIFASDCSTISEGSDYSLNFIYYQLMLKQQDIYKTQTGGAQPHIHPSDVAPIEIAIPPLPEQTAIAEILGEMDAEILALEERRKKTAGIKQGMMQELLTGRVRLV